MRSTSILAAVAAALFLAGTASAQIALTGNGSPAGEHYNLNILGSSTLKKQQIEGGNRIFVPLYGEADIYLAEGPEFHVNDGNATDGEGEFELPDPDPENDGVTAWSVYARALGKPGGIATMTTCFEENGERWCSTENVILTRSDGQSQFIDVTSELVTVCQDTDEPADGECDERSMIFDDENRDYLWHYDNEGLKVAQLRFYPNGQDLCAKYASEGLVTLPYCEQ